MLYKLKLCLTYSALGIMGIEANSPEEAVRIFIQKMKEKHGDKAFDAVCEIARNMAWDDTLLEVGADGPDGEFNDWEEWREVPGEFLFNPHHEAGWPEDQREHEIEQALKEGV